jgi:hypothetical protein
MPLVPALKTSLLTAALSICALAQAPAGAAKEEAKGLPPRSSPADYQSRVQVGKVTFAGDFSGHLVNTIEGNLKTENYVVVELGVFGAAGEHATLSLDDFSLRINGKKPEGSQAYSFVLPSLSDPDWEATITTPDDKKEKKKSPDLTAPPPPPPFYPPEIRRAMEQRIRKVQLPLGDRPVPLAGLLFFPYNGRTDKLRSVELLYSGAAGKATLAFPQ